MSESMITKMALGDALIELCHHKRFEKINISDITERCGLNRQTFYYHFTDKYDLLAWLYQERTFKELRGDVRLDNWEGQVCLMLESIQKYHNFYRNTVGADPNTFAIVFGGVTSHLFLELFARLDKEGLVNLEDRRFYAKFFSYGCSGVVIEWIQGGAKVSAEAIGHQLFRLAKDTERLANTRYEEELAEGSERYI
ncbi:TetR/AcrR family transcriptional regulator C-terminal domain-containing protein [uncultured Vagococcus sp.]|uniref:TetR/AcrR family transcriptional regulator C-terminal domain-containing protein n=1 Tax=uncultured Vagococcus sp. TaxID=189676 RepID=UPI0028D36E70|nr:TetR/AcrR family transcriptional regulator C-terminal domain-containing protein [uncultured Vagococcus sp.]